MIGFQGEGVVVCKLQLGYLTKMLVCVYGKLGTDVRLLLSTTVSSIN